MHQSWFEPLLIGVTLGSLLLALVSLVVIPILIVRMPADYFIARRRRRKRRPELLWFTVLRNVVAAILLILGILMLVLPGQGLLTILAAVVVSDIPGKYRLERWLITRPGILRGINWIRRAYKKPEVEAPVSIKD